jgi:hypothetical protein
MTEILIWLSLATPIILGLYVLYRIVIWLSEKYPLRGSYGQAQYQNVAPTYKSTETKITSKPAKPKKNEPPSPLKEMVVEFPEVTSIDKDGWDAEEKVMIDSQKIVEAGSKVWRTYRSIDGLSWAECDPALTERAACNYGSYIKQCNPTEFVRVNDPAGLIVQYE